MRSSRRQVRLAIQLVPLALLAAVACRKAPPIREFAVVGQIVAIDRSTNYVTLRHEDIKGFMPGMTMPFAVKDPALLEGRVPGDLVTATLQVQNTDAWISRLTQDRLGAAAGRRRRAADAGSGAGRPRAGSGICRPGRHAADDGVDGWTRGGRDVHLHALSAAGLLPGDRSAVCRIAGGDQERFGFVRFPGRRAAVVRQHRPGVRSARRAEGARAEAGGRPDGVAIRDDAGGGD